MYCRNCSPAPDGQGERSRANPAKFQGQKVSDFWPEQDYRVRMAANFFAECRRAVNDDGT
jgi:hypothetical protein